MVLSGTGSPIADQNPAEKQRGVLTEPKESKATPGILFSLSQRQCRKAVLIYSDVLLAFASLKALFSLCSGSRARQS